jgi:hypothetical protein
MNSLKEKLREVEHTSKLSHSVNENTVPLSNYPDATGNVSLALFGSRRALAYERDEPLPSMFRDTDFRSVRDGKLFDVAPSESDPVNAPTNFYPYVGAALFLCLVGSVAVYFAAANPSSDKGAVKPITKADVDKAATPDRGATATAAFFSAPPAVDKAAWQTQAVAITPSSAAEPEAWSDTVDTFKKLLAEQKASQAPGLQQSEAERVLGQLEAWSKAKAR